MAADPAQNNNHRPAWGKATSSAEELQFLAGPRKRLEELARAFRIFLEFIKGFRALHFVGPCVTVFGSARFKEGDAYYTVARDIGARIARMGFTVMTGGGPGIMEAANRGATDAGAVSIGFNISLPAEQEPNAWSTPELTFRFHYFAMRKMHLAMRANALVAFPGGFGTFDELFEVLTLRQTQKSPPIPIVMFDEAYWRSVINFEALLSAGMIEAADLALFRFADTPEDLWARLIEGGVRPNAEPAWHASPDIHKT